jgi:two-component system, NtrC family, sensor kinase
MLLGTRVFVLLLTIFIISGVVVHVVERTLIYPRFLAIEHAQATQNLERAVQALQRELDQLVPLTKTWASWDDAYWFMQDRDQTFVTTNLNAEGLRLLGVDVLALYDLEGALAWGGAYDIHTGEALDLPTLMPPRLTAERIPGGGSVEDPRAGLVRTSAGPFLLVSFPVLTTADSGPPRGALMMARRLEAHAAVRLASQVRLDLRLSTPTPGAPTLLGTTQPGHLAHTPTVLHERPDVTVTETTLMDLDGDPALTLKVSTPREISAGGRHALRLANLSMGVAGILVMILTMLGLRQIVLAPLSRLTEHAGALGTDEGEAIRLKLDRKDEIGMLARAFDRMTERLALTRQRLVEQSYRSGVAETARGVLHNLGNAVTPIGVKLAGLRAAVRRAPLEEVDLAVAELADAATDPARRQDLQGFLELACRDLAATVRALPRELETIQIQIDHVQRILLDQRRFTRAEPVLEAVDLEPLIQEVIRLFPETWLERIRIELDPGLRRIPPIRAVRVLLQQVIGNLLINALEAIADGHERRAETGRILISAGEEMHEGVPVIHLRMIDNGVGIPAAKLPHLFETGFSTKKRGSGMGLAWSANSIMGMGGRLFIESEGPDLGACVHLLLPLSPAMDTRTKEEAT